MKGSLVLRTVTGGWRRVAGGLDATAMEAASPETERTIARASRALRGPALCLIVAAGINLAVESRYADVLQEHRRLLWEWCHATGDTFGKHYSHPGQVSVPGYEWKG